MKNPVISMVQTIKQCNSLVAMELLHGQGYNFKVGMEAQDNEIADKVTMMLLNEVTIETPQQVTQASQASQDPIEQVTLVDAPKQAERLIQPVKATATVEVSKYEEINDYVTYVAKHLDEIDVTGIDVTSDEINKFIRCKEKDPEDALNQIFDEARCEEIIAIYSVLYSYEDEETFEFMKPHLGHQHINELEYEHLAMEHILNYLHQPSQATRTALLNVYKQWCEASIGKQLTHEEATEKVETELKELIANLDLGTMKGDTPTRKWLADQSKIISKITDRNNGWYASLMSLTQPHLTRNEIYNKEVTIDTDALDECIVKLFKVPKEDKTNELNNLIKFIKNAK